MEHRYAFSTSQMFENEQDQNWNHMHVEQPYANLARGGPRDNGSSFYPVENISVDGVHFTSQWNPAPMSNGYISSRQNVEVIHYQPDPPVPNVDVMHCQPDPSVPTHDPFLHSSNVRPFCTIPENHVHNAPSSSYDRHTFHGIEGGFVDLTMDSGRGPHKRKSPGISSACERGSTSRSYIAGSSSDLPPSELQPEKPNLDPEYMPWECNAMIPSNRGNLSLGANGSARNVRSRPAIDLEPNLVRPHLSSNPSHSSYSASHPIDHSISLDFSSQSSSAMTNEWSHARTSSAHGRILASYISSSSHETNQFLVGNSVTNAPVDIRGCHHGCISSRNPNGRQSFHDASSHSVRGVRRSYSQRSCPTFRASSSSLRLGHVGPADESLPLVADSYSPTQPRPFPTTAWNNSDRIGRSRISYDRFHSPSNEGVLHDRLSSADFMVMDRSAIYGSRNTLDQNREMRLDIDNMSYEELLALGERIGTVSTGLSENLISKCLMETVYCSSDESQEEGNCVICLEEYRDMDDVGALKFCGHDYHVSCIKKWLSMKNSCPICKASALADNMKDG